MADDSGIIVLNVPEVAGALGKWPEIARPEYQAATEASLLGMVPELSHYPSAPEGSTYRRTGTLGRTWTAAQPEFQAMSSGFEGTLGNSTPYAVWVEGPTGERPGQATVHQGRWASVSKLEKSAKTKVEALFTAACERIADKINRVTT